MSYFAVAKEQIPLITKSVINRYIEATYLSHQSIAGFL